MASTRATGFDWKGFWAMWNGFEGDKLAYLAMMASDASFEITGDWLEQWLRAEIVRRRANPGQNVTEPAHEARRPLGAEPG